MNLKSYESMDIHILLGLVNTALRNDFQDLDDLVKSHDLCGNLLRERFKTIGMIYYRDINQFRPE